MDRGDRFDNTWDREDEDFSDLLDVDDLGPPLPPPPEEPRGGKPERPERPQLPHDRVFHPAWTAGALTLVCLFGALQVLMIQAGARGGYLMVALLAGSFSVVFLVPMLVGRWWIGRIQEQDRR